MARPRGRTNDLQGHNPRVRRRPAASDNAKGLARRETRFHPPSHAEQFFPNEAVSANF
jgi:hypothetical protein